MFLLMIKLVITAADVVMLTRDITQGVYIIIAMSVIITVAAVMLMQVTATTVVSRVVIGQLLTPSATANKLCCDVRNTVVLECYVV